MDILRMLSLIFLWLLYILSCTYGGYIPPGPRYRCPEQSQLLYPCKCISETDDGVSIWCENSNLASLSVGLNNLATFKLPIEALTLRKCKFARFYGSLLYKLQLRRLFIEDTPIEKIEEHTFLGVNNTLNEIHIINSSLSEFPKLAFQILGNLTTLRIDLHKITTIPKDAFVDTDLSGKLLSFQLSNGNLSDLPIESLQPLRKLKMLDLHGNRMRALKRNQFRGLRDTEKLDLSHNEIAKIDSSHLADLIKLSFLNVSNNQMTELTRGAFARNSVLKLLNMSFNKIKRLDSNSFRGMRFLRRLYLSDNLISDVGRGTFASVTRIGTIDLARNFITKVDYQMFFQLNFIESIDLAENNITEVQKLAFKDIYFANVNLSRNSINKIEQGAFENCANITLLDLSHNLITVIPKKTFDETTYATELRLSYNNITDMSQVPLHNMTGIKVLNISHNMLTTIPKGTFPKLYELHTIDLSHNNLSVIFNSVFQTLLSLRYLNLSHNNLDTIKPSTFGTLPSLLELDLSYSNVNEMARSALAKMASMRRLILAGNKLNKLFQLPISVSHLDLSHNEFDEIKPKLWPSMNSLLSLDLSHNRLGDNLVKGSFEGLLTLQSLNLNYNGIGEPPWQALSDFTTIQYLYFEGNNITKLSKGAFGVLPVVFELNLANNNINNITVKAFDGLLQLLVLNLTNNDLMRIPNGAFQGLVSLRTLDLSFNRIERIDNKTHGLLDDCLSLERVNLSHNRFSFINRKTFPSNPWIPYKLKEIDLSYNSMPLITYDLVYGSSKLENLNLSHNAIGDIRKGVIGNLTRLKSLDLSYNKLEDVSADNETFRLPENITDLYLSNNVLSTLPWGHLENATRLNLIDIRFNNFDSFSNTLTKMVHDGSKIYFAGNPLSCDCFARPLRRVFKERLIIDGIYKEIKCLNPPYLKDRPLYEIDDDRLNCPSNVNVTRLMQTLPGDYDVTTDLKIRELKLERNKIMRIKWRVLKNDDIADTFVIIRDTNDTNKIIYQKTLPYFKRALEVHLKNELNIDMNEKNTNGEHYQICLIAKDSTNVNRGFFKEQCRTIGNQTNRSTSNYPNCVICYYLLLLIYLFVNN